MSYIIIGLPDEPTEQVAVKVEQWWNRQERSWVTMLVDENGAQVGDSMYDGDRSGAAASKRMMERQLRGE